MKATIKLLIIFVLSISLHASQELEKVSVQLDWKYQFQHAGFIMALEKGFYKEAGLDAALLEYENDIDIKEDVLSKKVDFGISNTTLIYKDKILEPVVLLATYLQRSPLVFVTQPEITELYQLDGKKIMATDYEYKNSSLSLLMEHFFVNNIHVPHTYGIEEFRDKKIDAMSAFTSNELYELDRQKVPYNLIDPFQYGFMTSGMNLFSSYKLAQNEPEKIRKFLKATKKGWEYAVNHTDETIEIIHSKYNRNKTKEALAFEAKEIKSLMLMEICDIGEVSKELVLRTYKQLTRSGKVLANQENSIHVLSDSLNKCNAVFTPEEIKYLKEKESIKLCVNPSWMPFEGEVNGKYIGITADYFELVKKEFDINIEVQLKSSWDKTLASMKNGECDIIGTASPTPKRMKYMNFTDAYIKSPIVLITTMDKSFIDDIEDVSKRKLGITKGYAIAELLRVKYPDINIVEVANIEDGLKKVEKGELYGYIDNLSVTVANIQKSFNGILKVSARLDESDDLTIGSRNDEPMLNSIFQKVVHGVDKAKIRKILNEWISVKESVETDYTFLWKLALGVFGIFLIISFYSYKLKLNNKKLMQLSREDALTKVGNRLKLNEVLVYQHKYTQRYRTPCGLMLLDIDDFKKVNDIHGHLVGDEVLKKFAMLLSKNIRDTDSLGRWGGEEFLIICPHTNIENLEKLANGLRKNIENYDFEENIEKITSSFGVSVFDGNKTVEEVLDKADEGLYLAKNRGKNRVVSLVT